MAGVGLLGGAVADIVMADLRSAFGAQKGDTTFCAAFVYFSTSNPFFFFVFFCVLQGVRYFLGFENTLPFFFLCFFFCRQRSKVVFKHYHRVQVIMLAMVSCFVCTCVVGGVEPPLSEQIRCW